MKKAIAFTTLFLGMNLFGGLLFLQSCEVDDGCGDFTKHKFDRVESDLYRLLVLDGTVDRMQTLSSERISYDSLAIQLIFNSSPITQNRGSTFLNLALACDPPIPTFTAKEIRVTSTAAFDSSHPPGTDLSALLKLGTSFDESAPLREFLTAREISSRQDYYMTFTLSPMEELPHTITIEFTNEYDEVFSTTLRAVTITY